MEKLGRMIFGSQQETSPKTPAETSGAADGDMLRANNNDIRLITAKVSRTLPEGARTVATDLVILTDDPMEVHRLRGADFTDELNDRLAMNCGVAFRSIRVMHAAVTAGCSMLRPGLYIRLDNTAAPSAGGGAVRARIAAVPGAGSLERPEYIIDSEGVYSIGAGAQTRLSNGALHTNHIVISTDSADPGFAQNRYVSRTHAVIEYTPEHGFLLRPDIKGTSVMGKRTRILRGHDDPIDLSNPMVAVKLADGDIIELSKSVLLTFNLQQC